jgi:nucleoid-associated protein YgaU
MRTDVKLGVAIGGALCLLVVAFLTFKPAPSDGEVRLIIDGDDAPAEMPEVTRDRPSRDDAVAVRPTRRGADEPPAGREARPDGRLADGEATPTGPGRGVNWARLLESGTPLMSAGPARPDPNVAYMFPPAAPEPAEEAEPAVEAADAWSATSSQTPPSPAEAAEAVVEQWTDAPALAYVPPMPQALRPGLADRPQPREGTSGISDRVPAGTRTHTVQQGETLSAIAAAAYGSASAYPHIMRANPEVDPNRLRPGTVLQLPDPAAVRPDMTTPAGGAGEAPIDSSREYRVQENDSLYRISMKLYGRGDQVDAIYELNRDAIGSNPDRLKLNMVLKLPEPPRNE